MKIKKQTKAHNIQPIKVIKNAKPEKELIKQLKLARRIVLIEDRKLLKELAKH